MLKASFAVLLLASHGIAHAAEPPCLTPAEFTAVTTYALPGAIEGARQRCGPALASTAFLNRSGAALVARYGKDREKVWPQAKRALAKLGGTGDALIGLPDSSLQQIADAFVSGLVSERVPVEQCAMIDRLVQLLSPLPPANTAELVAVAVGLTAKGGGADAGPLRLCPAP